MLLRITSFNTSDKTYIASGINSPVRVLPSCLYIIHICVHSKYRVGDIATKCHSFGLLILHPLKNGSIQQTEGRKQIYNYKSQNTHIQK